MNLKLGDCLDKDLGLCTLHSKSIDMILCDLPYGITSNKWDKQLDLTALFKEYDRVIKDNGVIALFGVQPFTSDLINYYRKNFRYELIWNKQRGTDFFNCYKKPLRCHENIIIFYKKRPTYNTQMTKAEKLYKRQERPIYQSPNWSGLTIKSSKETGFRYPKTIINVNSEYGLHPTQKPVQLCEWLIKTYTNENDIVLDNCFGSGTTAVACKNTNRKFIGYELNENYYKIAVERIGAANVNNNNNIL